MCGRFVSARERQQLIDEFGIERDQVAGELAPDYNVAPTDPIYAVMTRAPREDRDAPPVRELHTVRWGLIPSWAKDLSGAGRLINARAETVTEKPSFRNAFARRRCLIPADGYYEWHTSDNRKRPYFIHRRDGAPVGFAALAETWMGPNGEELDTVAIVTAAAGADLAVLHHRVPVTIAPADFERWLGGFPDDVTEAMALLIAPREGEFAWHEISTRVNHVANDDAQLILPITAEQREAEQAKPAKKTSPRKVGSADSDDGQGSLF